MISVLRNAAFHLSISMLAATSLASTTQAQLIGLKTVPVPSGEQFLIYPSRNLPMGGVSIALPDPLLDPFSNPALGARVHGVQLHALPTLYSGSGNDIGGISLPLHLVLGSERHFGGFGVVLQQLSNPNVNRFFPVPLQSAKTSSSSFIGNASPANTYVHAFYGGTRKAGANKVSLAGSVFWAGLGGVDGVSRLYTGNSQLEQDGHMLDYRLGILTEMPKGRSLEANIVRNQFSMTHTISYAEWRVLPRNPAVPPNPPNVEWFTRTETNLDHTNSTGLHIGYRQPLNADGWRFGALLNLDRMTHPKIPTYNLVSVQNIPMPRIPRDPGDSRAANLGVGLAYEKGPTLFGLDLIFEPAWSHTWADTTTTIRTRTGGTLSPGQKTVDNTFRFTNVAIATGMSREYDKAGFQLGLQLRSTRYTLHQVNFVQVQEYRTRESWMEWTPSWGASLKLGSARLRYVGRLTIKGSPDFGFPGDRFVTAPMAEAGATSFLVPVTSAVFLPDFYVFTNQISFSIPIGK